LLARPRPGDFTAFCDVIYDQDQLIAVIAIKHFDVDASLGHPAGEFTELTRFGLVEPLDENFALVQYLDASCFQRASGRSAIVEEEVCGSLTFDDPGAAAFDAYSGAAENVSHVG
jgi:hypothetical protein